MHASDPRHGTRAGYLAGCREPDCCAEANRAYCKQYRNRKIISGGDVTTPAQTVVPHLMHLLEHMSMGSVAAAADTHSSHIHRIVNGETKRVTNGMATRLLAVEPTTRANTKWVSARSSARRIQSLVALGHTLPRLAARLDYPRQSLWLLAHGRREWISSKWDAEIREAWEELSMRLPTPTDRFERGAVTRALESARGKGWAPPLAWDDIDDPNETPRLPDRNRAMRHHTDIDPTIVDRLAAGEPVEHSTRDEKRAAMARWLASGKSEQSLCRIHGWKDGRYTPRKDAA